MISTSKRVKLSTNPTESELKTWDALSRQEQLHNLKLDMAEALESGEARHSIEETIQQAKQKVDEYRANR